jgi:hypothetical protein
MYEPGFTGFKDSISDSKFQIQRLEGKRNPKKIII